MAFSIRMKISRQPKKGTEKTWIRHSLKEIVALFKRVSTTILRAMEVEKQVSDKDNGNGRIHWAPKCLAGLDSSNNQKVTQQCPQIEKQERDKHNFLPNRILGQPKQNELSRYYSAA